MNPDEVRSVDVLRCAQHGGMNLRSVGGDLLGVEGRGFNDLEKFHSHAFRS